MRHSVSELRPCPASHGMHTAPLPDGEAQTAFILLSAVNNGVDLEVFAQRLFQAKPTPLPLRSESWQNTDGC